MRLYLIRHAEAVDSPPGARFLDDLRALTPRGGKRFRRTARTFADLGEPVQSLRSSPTLRAVQTAELLAAQLKRAPVAVLDELRPGVAAVVLRDWLLTQDLDSIALVGHGRQLRELTRLLLGPQPPFAIKKGSIVRIDLRGKKARPRWWLRDQEQALSA
jgi:phosphohistidine phosphatase